MTQPLPHIDLDAIQDRYDLAKSIFDNLPDLDAIDHAVDCAQDVPALIAEIRRLQQMLHPANVLAPGWQAAIEALEAEAKDWQEKGDTGRWSMLELAAATLVRLEQRPRLTTAEVWLRTSPTMRQSCQAWYDSTREGWVLDEHPLLETLERVRHMVRERDAIIEGLEADVAAQEVVVVAVRDYEEASTNYAEVMPITNGHETMLRDAEIEARRKLTAAVRGVNQETHGWRALVRQQIAELAAKDVLIKDLEDASAAQQVEIERLRVLLNEAHADADELLYPSFAHRVGEQP